MWRKVILWVVGSVIVLAVVGYGAFKLSPWPSVLAIRYVFAQGGKQASATAEPLVPEGISASQGLSYASGDEDANYDVFAPQDADGPLPAVVWVHGGGFVAGSRSDLTNYLKILAGRGFVAVAVDYSRAPGAQFPVPVRQTNAALAHVRSNAKALGIDPNRIFLAGDSAGAQIVAQTALVISDPAFSRRVGIKPAMPRDALRGMVLFCGPYDAGLLNFDNETSWFMQTVAWSYLGTKDPDDPRMANLSVAPYVTANYPPAFISVGNADPLAQHSYVLARALKAKGVEADTLFFPANHQPPLGHEYQMNLSTEAGRLAFERFVAFLSAHLDVRAVRSAPLPTAQPKPFEASFAFAARNATPHSRVKKSSLSVVRHKATQKFSSHCRKWFAFSQSACRRVSLLGGYWSANRREATVRPRMHNSAIGAENSHWATSCSVIATPCVQLK
jgi:acetyl esterase/lipase